MEFALSANAIEYPQWIKDVVPKMIKTKPKRFTSIDQRYYGRKCLNKFATRNALTVILYYPLYKNERTRRTLRIYMPIKKN